MIELVQTWNLAPVRSDDLSQDLQGKVVREVIVPAVQDYKDELILTYHEFLTMVRSGSHSFVHGSEMISKTAYWVSVARIADGDFIEVPKVVHPPCGPEGEPVFSFITPRKFLAPVFWRSYLSPRYRNSHQPYFVITPEKSVEEANMFDVSYFGEQFFRLRQGKHDWATKVEIVVGNESVGEWLRKTKSARTYNQLQRK